VADHLAEQVVETRIIAQVVEREVVLNKNHPGYQRSTSRVIDSENTLIAHLRSGLESLAR